MDALHIEFRDLLQRARSHCPEAERELVNRFQSTIVRALRRKLPARLRSLLDLDDLIQEVWQAFFAQGLWTQDFEGPDNLARFLAALARKRAAKAVRDHLGRQKRDRRRDYSLTDPAVSGERQPMAHGLTPLETAAARDEWEHVLAVQPHLTRRALELWCQGYTHTEVGRELGRSERTIQRLAQRVLRGRQVQAVPAGGGGQITPWQTEN